MNATMARFAEAAFSPSPVGVGEDCYRTYELLALGSVPVLLRSNLTTSVFGNGHGDGEDPPALIVNRWSDLTPQLLRSAVGQFYRPGRMAWNLQKLTRRYWHHHLQSRDWELEDPAAVDSPRVNASLRRPTRESTCEHRFTVREHDAWRVVDRGLRASSDQWAEWKMVHRAQSTTNKLLEDEGLERRPRRYLLVAGYLVVVAFWACFRVRCTFS